jgi:hypothetical protein
MAIISLASMTSASAASMPGPTSRMVPSSTRMSARSNSPSV